MQQWLTVDEVARRIRVSEETIREFIRRKKIRAMKIGRWFVSAEDLEVFIRSRMNVSQIRDASGERSRPLSAGGQG